jgi:lysozyme family protein
MNFTSTALRHHLASLLIDSGCDVKTARMRHQSAKTTLDVYGHLWPDKDETTRTAIGGAIAARAVSLSADPAGGPRAKRPNTTEIAAQSGSPAYTS